MADRVEFFREFGPQRTDAIRKMHKVATGGSVLMYLYLVLCVLLFPLCPESAISGLLEIPPEL